VPVNPHVSTVILGAGRVVPAAGDLAALEFLPKLDAGALERIEEIVASKPEPLEHF
jgi:hypothetical protein